MKISVISQDGKGDFINPKSGPWKAFFDALTENKHEIVPFNESPQLIIFMNNHSRLLRKAKNKFNDAKKVLILWESRITKPQNFLLKDINSYNFIYTPSYKWIQGSNVRQFNFPQGPSKISFSTMEEWKRRSDTLILFQANKYSFVKGEQYSLRRSVIAGLDKELILFGKSWNKKFANCMILIRALLLFIRYWYVVPFTTPKNIWIYAQNYSGFIVEKKSVLETAKFSLVIENSLDYVSEKLFESISYGCVVIYCGPPLEDFDIPSDIVFTCEASVSAVIEAYHYLLKNVDEAFTIAKSASEFHNSESFKKFYNERVLKELAEDILRESEIN
jgi:hypothetical protein